MSSENIVNLSKQPLPQLLELLDRQNALLQNRKLLQHLKDKGESVKQFQDKIQKEIEHRKNLESVQASLAALSITAGRTNAEVVKQTHVEYVCNKEKSTEDERYRPHRTLIHKATKSPSQKSPKKFTEVTAAFEPELIHGPTKCISLAESLVIQNDQVLRLVEERVKKTFGLLNDDAEESDGSDDGNEAQDLEHVPIDAELINS